jgi:hypothetical protein
VGIKCSRQTTSMYLAEHLPYELLMLRYAHRQLSQSRDQLHWNMSLEAFSIHARNLRDFLLNDGGSNNFKASDFLDNYTSSRQDLAGAMQKLNTQILHMAKSRPADDVKKFNTDQAHTLYQWLEDAMTEFLSSLSPGYRACWNEENSRIPATARLPFSPTSTNVPAKLSVLGPFPMRPSRYPDPLTPSLRCLPPMSSDLATGSSNTECRHASLGAAACRAGMYGIMGRRYSVVFLPPFTAHRHRPSRSLPRPLQRRRP